MRERDQREVQGLWNCRTEVPNGALRVERSGKRHFLVNSSFLCYKVMMNTFFGINLCPHFQFTLKAIPRSGGELPEII